MRNNIIRWVLLCGAVAAVVFGCQASSQDTASDSIDIDAVDDGPVVELETRAESPRQGFGLGETPSAETDAETDVDADAETDADVTSSGGAVSYTHLTLPTTPYV